MWREQIARDLDFLIGTFVPKGVPLKEFLGGVVI
jgi:hypothetical protein